MNRALRENLRITALAWVSIPIALGVYFVADWLLHTWMRWVEFGIFTAVIFGALGFQIQADVRKPKCLITFVGLLVLHCAVFVHLLRSGLEIRTAWYVPVVFAETFVFALILTGPGRARSKED
jgi:hypothetical protein